MDVVSKSLAVKYRPKKLKDLVGQKPIVSILKGMFKKQQVPAAFLLEGHTGGGKTTLARIIHNYLNCEKGNACGKCSSCKMDAKTHPDLVNINAGTDGRVEDIRKLVKGANVAPMYNKRVIIIDECLTGETQVLLDFDGNKATIKEIVDNPAKYTHVVSYNLNTRKNEMMPISNRFELDKNSDCLLDIEFDNGFILKGVTDNHPIWSVTKKCYVRAGDIEPDEEVLQFKPQ